MEQVVVELQDGSRCEVAAGSSLGALAQRLGLTGVVAAFVDGRAHDLAAPVARSAPVPVGAF